jgi:hypothetical protein
MMSAGTDENGYEAADVSEGILPRFNTQRVVAG